MQKTLNTRRHRELVDLLIRQRESAGMTQADLAKKLGEYQSFVARLESGERRVDVVEFLKFSQALGFDPIAAIGYLSTIPD